VEVTVKVALTLRAWVIETVQVVLVPEQAPLQPEKLEPLPAAALRVTLVLSAKLPLQLLPQLTPLGLEVTVPLPVPFVLTVMV